LVAPLGALRASFRARGCYADLVKQRVILIDPDTKLVEIGGRPPRATLVLLVLEVGLFLAWAFADGPAWVNAHVAASAQRTLGALELWQPATALLVHVGSRGILANTFVLWLFGSALERWWGKGRFVLFFVVTGVLGNAAGVAVGLLRPREILSGSAGATAAMLVAFAVIFANHLVRVWRGVLPLKAKHLGPLLLGFLVVGNLVGKSFLELGALGGGSAAALLFLLRPSREEQAPRRARPASTGRLRVIEGGKGKSAKKDEPHYWN
jgi:membrane associated rhomboid family serine protease